MTASERARRLVTACRGAAQMVGVRVERGDADQLSLAIDRQAEALNALLAYVADLEACVAAARHHLTESRGPVHLIALREAEMALADCLAALDRPEDGEHGDKD